MNINDNIPLKKELQKPSVRVIIMIHPFEVLIVLNLDCYEYNSDVLFSDVTH